MTKYKKLQIIKHALQYYIQREGVSQKDVDAERRLLTEIEAEVAKETVRIDRWVNTSRIIDPLLIEWEQKKTELRRIVPIADWIINEIKPEANQYPLPVAIGRITIFIQLALKGIDESELLAAAQNYREHLLLMAHTYLRR